MCAFVNNKNILLLKEIDSLIVIVNELDKDVITLNMKIEK